MGSQAGDTWTLVQEALLLEHKYQPALRLCTSAQQNGGEVTMSMRDGSAQVLRCLKAWYELPSDVLVDALNIVDRFLSRMRTRPKHLSCIAISAFLLSVRYAAAASAAGVSSTDPSSGDVSAGAAVVAVPSACELVALSQAKCSAGDVARMCTIIGDKLGCDPAASHTRPLTAASWLRLLARLSCHVAATPLPLERLLLPRLECVLCSGRAANIRSCELALALVSAVGAPPSSSAVTPLLEHVRRVCAVDAASLAASRQLVAQLLASYEAAVRVPRRLRQRLLWRLSTRTMRQLRPTTQLLTVLPTIEEGGSFSASTPDGGSVAAGGGAVGGAAKSRRGARCRSLVRGVRRSCVVNVDNQQLKGCDVENH